MEALAMYPDVFCAELLVPCPPRHQFSGDYEIAMPETGWPSDRSQFNMVYGAARDPLALAMNPALLQSDRILCEFCQKDYAMAGIYRHIQAAHPEEYDAWKARLDATKAEAAPGVRTLSPAPAEGPAPAEDPEADGPATPPPADTDDEGLDDIERDMTEETL
ncbi:MAG: hypothetical protein FJX72_17415 [Armatimonadetes bacterium]|nr:hypothetical protein [Armatimonadota bacterium]